MSFINEESGICLSPSGETIYAGCNSIINENGLRYVNTEYPKRIKPEGGCRPITEFDCKKIERIVVDSGKFVTIINTCTLPLTITGLKNSNPDRFSIFKYPVYSGFSEYTTGNTEELPITIEPYQRINIDTFFHPLYSELLSGSAGSLESRTGDKFGATFDILPGFEILNCKEDPITSILWWEENQDCDLVLSKKAIKSSSPAMQLFQESGADSYTIRDEAYFSTTEDAQYFEQKGSEDVVVKFSSNATSSYCSASFELQGEFICYQEGDLDWMLNTGNFIEKENYDLPAIGGDYCVPFMGPFSNDIPVGLTVQEGYKKLSSMGEQIKLVLGNNPKWQSEGNPSWSGAMGVFDEMINVITREGGDDDYQNIINKVFPRTGINTIIRKIPQKGGGTSDEVVVVSGEYDGSAPLSSFIYDVPGSAKLTGVNIKITAEETFKNDFVIKDSSVLFGKTNNGEKMIMLISDSGDINTDGLCGDSYY